MKFHLTLLSILLEGVKRFSYTVREYELGSEKSFAVKKFNFL